MTTTEMKKAILIEINDMVLETYLTREDAEDAIAALYTLTPKETREMYKAWELNAY